MLKNKLVLIAIVALLQAKTAWAQQKFFGPQFSTEFFDVAYTRIAHTMWDDRGSEAKRHVAIKDPFPRSPFNPFEDNGYFILGDLLTNPEKESTQDLYSIALKPKAGYEHLLKAPDDFEKVWDDSGTGANKDCSIWRMKSNDPDYVALGMVATNGKNTKPSSGLYRMVKKTVKYDGGVMSLVVPIGYKSESQQEPMGFWDDRGSGGNVDVALFQVSVPKSLKTPASSLALVPSVFFASTEKGFGRFPTDTPYMLTLFSKGHHLRGALTENKPVIPKLTSTNPPQEGERCVHEYELPFYKVHDSRFTSAVTQAEESPTYKVKRITYYRPANTVLSTQDGTQLSWSIEKSEETSTGWSKDSSHEISASVTIGAELEISPLGIGGNASLQATGGYAYTVSSGSSGGESIGEAKTGGIEVSVNHGQRAVIWEVVDEYEVTRTDGTRVDGYQTKTPNHFMHFHASFYPPNPPSPPEKASFTNSIGMEFKLIKAGEFMMGSQETEEDREDDEFRHKVKLSRDFYLGVTEVTQAQWQKVMGTTPWVNQEWAKEGENYPAQCILWDEANAFCRKLSQQEGRMYRLPTEAEWEYACRAGTTTRYSFGDDESKLLDYAWFESDLEHEPTTGPREVRQGMANGFGLYDMHGNVAEWCEDWYSSDYPQKSVTNPTGPSKPHKSRIVRGGMFGSPSHHLRSARRGAVDTTKGPKAAFGFRVVLVHRH